MKCPNCGEEMNEGKAKCLRCGYEIKDLSVNVRSDGDGNSEQNDTETVDIDPSKVHLSGGGEDRGSIFGDMFGGGLFGGLFGGILDDIFGFGGDSYSSYDIFGNQDYDVDDEEEESEIVEIKHVEYLDEHGNPVDKKGKHKGKRHGKNRDEK